MSAWRVWTAARPAGRARAVAWALPVPSRGREMARRPVLVGHGRDVTREGGSPAGVGPRTRPTGEQAGPRGARCRLRPGIWSTPSSEGAASGEGTAQLLLRSTQDHRGVPECTHTWSFIVYVPGQVLTALSVPASWSRGHAVQHGGEHTAGPGSDAGGCRDANEGRALDKHRPSACTAPPCLWSPGRFPPRVLPHFPCLLPLFSLSFSTLFLTSSFASSSYNLLCWHCHVRLFSTSSKALH